jgi:hypothetical protein
MYQQKSTANQAAAEIVALINARPRSPSQQEVADIIARHVGSDAPEIHGTTTVHAEIHALLRDLVQADRRFSAMPDKERTDGDADAVFLPMFDRLEELQSQLARPPRSLADCVAFAEIAHHWRKIDPNDEEIFLRAAQPLAEGIVLHLARYHNPAAAIPKAEAIALCRRVEKALLSETESNKACDAAERLRRRLAAKSPKTLEDIAGLAALAFYWERNDNHFLEAVADGREDRIPIASRPLPTLLLAVAEYFGIDGKEFAI